jgi:NADH-quinone oxidoreductase subunit J
MMLIPAICFYVLAATAVVFSLGVIAFASPLYSALSLIGCLFSIAGIFALQSAQLLAVLQVLVYAGAIMVMILFVIMLLNLTPRELGPARVTRGKVFGAYVLAATGLLLLLRLPAHWWAAVPGVDRHFGSIEHVGTALYTEYLLPFEMVSLLLLAAIIGAVVLTRKPKANGGGS